MQTLLLIQNDELAVLVGLLQDVLALLDVAVVVFQAEERGNQRHIGLKGIRQGQHSRLIPVRLCVPQTAHTHFQVQLKRLVAIFLK